VPGVKAISRRNGIVLVSMEGIGMWQQVGFLADVFNLFKKHGLSVDLIGSAETNVTVSLDPSENLVNTDVLAALSADLSQICKVKVIVPCAAITLVGRGMRSLLHKLSDVWATFGRERVHMISQSSNDLNLTFVIDEADADGLLPILHAELIDSGAMPVEETEVFGPRWREIAGTVRPRGTPWWRGQRAPAAAGRCRYAALRLPPADGAPAPALAAIKPIDQRYYAIKANSHPAILQLLEAEGFGLECVARRAEACVPAPAGTVAARAVHPSFARAASTRRRSRWRDRHRRQRRSAAALAGPVPQPRAVAARRPGPWRRPPRQGQHRRQGVQVRPADRPRGRVRARGHRAGQPRGRPACAPGQRRGDRAALAPDVR
jgi:hypothetical protein